MKKEETRNETIANNVRDVFLLGAGMAYTDVTKWNIKHRNPDEQKARIRNLFKYMKKAYKIFDIDWDPKIEYSAVDKAWRSGETVCISETIRKN